jgi:mono/diheme cytochrome c family protein
VAGSSSAPAVRASARALALIVALTGAGAGAALLAGGCNSPGDDPGPPVPVDPALIYTQMCARCHGADGRGDPQIRQQLPVRDFSDPTFQARANSDDIARVIMGGKGQMPAFGGLLSAPKIQTLSGYVRRLGQGRAAR